MFLYIVRGEATVLVYNTSQRVAADGLTVISDFIQGATIEAASGNEAAVLQLIRKG